jgi:hypothetical protein
MLYAQLGLKIDIQIWDNMMQITGRYLTGPYLLQSISLTWLE